MSGRRRANAEQLSLLDFPQPRAVARAGRRRSVAGGPDAGLAEFLGGIDSAGDGMLAVDALVVEMQAAAFLGAARERADMVGQVDGMFERLGDHRTRECLAFLLAIHAVAEGSTRAVTAHAAARLAAAGVRRPAWADEVAAPLTPGEFWWLTEPGGEASVVTGTFHRAGSTHVVVITVDETDCGAASMIGMVPGGELTGVRRLLPQSTERALDGAWFRWHAESAMGIRADHERDDQALGLGRGFGRDEQEVAEYAAMSWLLRTRLAGLPQPDRPLRRHADLIDMGRRRASASATRQGKRKNDAKGRSAGTSRGTTALKGRPTPKPRASAPVDAHLVPLVDEVCAVGQELLGMDALTAEESGASFVSATAVRGDLGARAAEVVGALATRPTRASLAAALSVRAVADGAVGEAAATAVVCLTDVGVPMPAWAEDLARPLALGECWRVVSPAGATVALGAEFHRAGSTHVFVVTLCEENCGEADLVVVGTREELSTLDGLVSPATGKQQPLDAAEFRWEVESALRIRDLHDEADSGIDQADDDEAKRASLVVLLRRRLTLLPEADRPLREHDGERDGLIDDDPDLPEPSSRLAGSVYQLKVTLRWSKPPIWRRLEVPGDIALDQLHHVIQVAFAWQDDHLHVFDTPLGRYGVADPGLQIRAAERAVLAQVAPSVKAKLTYTYDFGDDWRHDIVVEKILDSDPQAVYPRCTGGRRAAPPDDCGGVSDYERVVTILADPAHPDYDDAASWFTDPAAFDPESFDAKYVNQRLAPLR